MRPLLFLTLLAFPLPLGAQIMRGTVVDSVTGDPVNGAIVVLLDSANRQHDGRFTDSTGAFELRVPAAGRYRVRAERVGYFGRLTPYFETDGTGTRAIRLPLAPAGARLAAVEVVESRRCVAHPERGIETARLWEDVRSALRAAVLTDQQRQVTLRIATFEREMNAREEERWSRRRERTTFSENPYVSVPIHVLAREGFVVAEGKDLLYRGPDARVLLSDEFLESHCFRVTAAAGAARDSLIGLAFEPMPDHTLTDVRGVLWVDRESAELRYLEFGYEKLDLPVGADRAGGRVEFRRLPTGHWIVWRWVIRMPIVAEHRTIGNSGEPPRIRHDLDGIREKGGEVLEIVPPQVVKRAGSVITGLVHDSTRGSRLAGARVYISGTSHATTTDERGRYTLAGVPAGVHTLGFLHPRLDSLGIVASPSLVTAGGSDTVAALLGIASWPAIIRGICGDSASLDRAALAGIVRSADRGTGLDEARVTIMWTPLPAGGQAARVRPRKVEVRTDRDGRFQACDLPANVPLAIDIGAHEHAPARRELRLRAGELTRLEESLRASPGTIDRPPQGPAPGR